MNKTVKRTFLSVLLAAAMAFSSIIYVPAFAVSTSSAAPSSSVITLDNIPEYSGEAYVALNGNKPSFKKSQLTTKAFEKYSDLDDLGRCGTAFANICTDIMPTEERGAIGSVKPTGWHTVKYDCVDGKYLYNRCHLIGYQLSGENANEKNLITGTRYLNVEGMLPFENMVADYVKETENHVLYRVTPIFKGKDLLAGGVQIEAYSVEDKGKGICFNVYCYNVQPGIKIDYATGESSLSSSVSAKSIKLNKTAASVTEGKTLTLKAAVSPSDSTDTVSWSTSNSKVATVNSKGVVTGVKAGTATITVKTSNGKKASCKVTVKKSGTSKTSSGSTKYILNTNTKKFHYPSCSSVDQMSDKNKKEYVGSREEVIAMGYDPCKRCNP